MLEVRDIYKTYRPKKGQPVKALDGVSIKFPEKGLVFILGKSGSGKSTLLNVLGGLDKVDEGEIIIKGKSSKDFSQGDFDSYRNTYLGFIFQEYNILNEFTVGENIALALQLQGKKATDDEITNILRQVDLEGYAKRKPNELSGGQKQRIAIARALIKNPEIILADEPTGALDSKTGLQVFDTLKSLSQDKLIIVVSHDREFAEMYGDRVIEMKDGKVISDIEKHSEKPAQSASGLITIDEHMLALKKGHVLTSEDVTALNSILANNDALISADNMVNKEFRRIARIDENLNRETFKDTDESKIEYKNSGEFSPIKSSLPLLNAFKIGVNALKSKPIRLFFTILLSVCAFGLFGIADTASTYSSVNTVYDGLSNSNTKTFSLKKEELEEGYSTPYYRESRINDDDIKELEETYNITVDPLYNQGNTSINEYLDYGSSSALFSNYGAFGYLALSSERLNELGFNIEYGSYPDNDDEVAITDYIYCSFKEKGYRSSMGDETIEPGAITQESLIGKTLNLNGRLYTISGIINTGFGYDASTSPYSVLADVDNSSIYQDDNLRSTSEKFNYEVSENYGNCLYLTESEIENSNNSYGFYTSSDFQYSYPRLEFQTDNTYFNFNTFTSLSRSQLPTKFIDENKTSLAENEILVSSNILEQIFSNSVDQSSIQLQDEDKTMINHRMETRYDDYGNNIENVAVEEPIYFDTLDQILYTPDEYIFDYAKANLPTSDIFNQFVREYTALVSYDQETDDPIYTPMDDSKITDDLKAIAYSEAISNPYRFTSGYNPDSHQYSDEVTQLFDEYNNLDYDQQRRENVFGGKLSDTLQQEYRSNLMIKYWPGDFTVYGYVGFDEPEMKEYKVVGYVDTSSVSSNQFDINNIGVISDSLFDSVFAPELTTGYSRVLFTTGGDATILKPLIESSYDEDSEYRYYLMNAVTSSISSFESLLAMFRTVFLYVSIGLAVFSALLLVNFISASITYKKREIGILRAVGAKSSDVFKIFFSEAFVIAIINFAIAALGAGIGSIFLNNMIVDAIGALGNFFMFSIRQIALMLLLSLGVAFIASFIPVYLIAKKRPVEAIRSN